MNLTDLKDRNSYEYKAQCNTCFMTGKACVYQSDIAQSLLGSGISNIIKQKDGNNKINGTAFMLMPFNSTLDEVYRAQLEPCIKSVIQHVKRADDIARTGYVICEKICKQIQLSDLVCAELSCNNANVFYELGLAYAIDRSIALFFKKKIDRNDIIKKLGLSEGEYNVYYPFDMLANKDVKLWSLSKHKKRRSSKDDKTVILLADSRKFKECINGQELTFAIDGLCRGAVNKTLDNCFNEEIEPFEMGKRKTITFNSGEISGYFEDKYSGERKKEAVSFKDVENYVRDAACVIICTHDAEPLSYFWLGFSHGLEKDVIPITVDLKNINKTRDQGSEEKEKKEQDSTDQSSSNLPFDIRALWHISFHYDRPTDLHDQLASVLSILIQRFKDKQHRRRFWQQFLEQDKVSVYVGSIELETEDKNSKRHVVGEWDYRTVSELTGFFASVKETMKTVIQAPTFQLKREIKNIEVDRNNYIEELKQKLFSSNSIVLATTDVNDMTEVALALNRPSIIPFVEKYSSDDFFNGIIAVKSRSREQKNKECLTNTLETHSVFCKFIGINEGAIPYRGFYDIKKGKESNRWIDTYFTYYVSNKKDEREKSYNVYYSHIAKFKIDNSKYWTVVLQGITGPATLGLAQALTGGINEQFTIFSKENSMNLELQIKLLNDVASAPDHNTLRQYLDNPDGSYKIFHDHLKEILQYSYDTDKSKLDNLIIRLKNQNVTSKIFQEHSEVITKKMTSAFDTNDAVEAVIRVYTTIGTDINHDDRLIIWWDFAMDPRKMSV